MIELCVKSLKAYMYSYCGILFSFFENGLIDFRVGGEGKS